MQAEYEDDKFVDVPDLERGGDGPYKDVFPTINEATLMRKVDLHVVPCMFALNFFTYLDRWVLTMVYTIEHHVNTYNLG